MNALKQGLVSKKQREVGGVLAQERFDYQTYWGATHVLSLYSAGIDFAVAFEFHDDILEISPAAEPVFLRCYQIKTKSNGNWSMGSLIKEKKAPSILSKIAENGVKFSENFVSGCLVSNAKYVFALPGKVKFSDLEVKVKDQVITHFKDKYGPLGSSLAEKLEFWSDAPPLQSYEKMFLGELVEFIESQLGELRTNQKAVSRVLLEQCRSRSKKNVSDLADFNSLISSKFLTRTDIDRWLRVIEKAAKHRPNLSDAIASSSIIHHSMIRTCWNQYDLRRDDVEDLVVEKLKNTAKSILGKNIHGSGAKTIGDYAYALLPTLMLELDDLATSLGEALCFVALIYEQLTGD